MKKSLKIFFTALIVTVLIAGLSFAANGDKGMKKITTNDMYTYFDGNTILMWMSNNGDCSFDPNSGGAGLYWPKGSGLTAVYEDGCLWGGYINGQLHVGGSAYRHGLQAGPMINATTAADPNDPKYKIYKIQKDYLAYQNTNPSLYSALAADYAAWPTDDGAPYDLDASGNKVPHFYGDQELWYIANDLDANRTTYLYGSNPMGLELQVTVFGFNQAGPLGQMIFKKYKLINKGGNRIDSMFVSQWNDIDLGDGNDDLSGCDTTLKLGYVYNGGAVDAKYGIPPADGFVFFQGPIVKGSPTDSAYFNFGRLPGYKNLPMTSFDFFINGSATYTDPTQGQPIGSIQMYRLMNGFIGNTGGPFIDPTTGKATPFALNGDPVKGTGWLDTAPGDRRENQSSGPFTMMPGDTQEVVVGFLIARASDRLSSLTLLKQYCSIAQSAFNINFVLPGAPPAPVVTVGQLDKKIVLDWGDPATSAKTESDDQVLIGTHYLFEGYNVYQLPTASATRDQAKRIATYDLVDGVTTILYPTFDPTAGVFLDQPQQYGTDNGVQRSITITKDYLLDQPLVNGSKYYFSVTAYSYNSNPPFGSNNLENPISILTCIPQGPKPGTAFNAQNGQVLPVGHTGPSAGVVSAVVIDPNRLQPKGYLVKFPDPTNSAKWSLSDSASGTVLFTSTAANATWNGVSITITGPSLTGVRRDDDPDQQGVEWWSDESTDQGIGGGASRFLSPQAFANYGCQAYGPAIFGAPATGYTPANSVSSLDGNAWYGISSNVNVLHRIEIRFGNYNGVAQTQKAYRFLRSATAAPARPEFAPYIVNKVGGYPFQDIRDVPFTVWDVDAAFGPTRQLNVGFLENNQAGTGLGGYNLGQVDGKWWPTASETGAREWLFVYQTTYNPTTPPAVLDILNGTNGDGDFKDIEYIFLPRLRSASYTVPNNCKLVFTPYYPNSSADVFSFSTSTLAPTSSVAQSKSDIALINVFPNPYLGRNSQETNKYNRFVTFSHLPKQATIRVFALSGIPVATINKNDDTQYAQWNLTNFNGIPVASGMYIVYIDLPGLGTKTLKLGVIQEAQYIDQI